MKKICLLAMIFLFIVFALCSCEIFHQHTESDWIIDVEASYEVEGRKHIECTICRETLKTESIEKISKELRFMLNEDKKSYSVYSNFEPNDTNIVIPDTFEGLPVTRIREYAFNNNNLIESITIPNSVTSIGHYAFSNCTNLKNVSMGNSVMNIEDYAFSVCTSLASITIPASVTNIGVWAFSICTSLANINIDENNAHYKSINGCIYSKDGKTLIRCPIGKDTMSFTISDSVTSIADAAFQGCELITNIIIPNSVTSIGNWAFSGCTSLVNVTIPKSVNSIGIWTFYNCTSLSNIIIPNSVTSIGDYSFVLCTSLTSIIIPASVTSIGDDAFYECTSLTIYCEAESQPNGWYPSWNSSDCPVVWDYKPE